MRWSLPLDSLTSNGRHHASEPKSWSARREIDLLMQYWMVSGGARGRAGWREVPSCRFGSFLAESGAYKLQETFDAIVGLRCD